MPSCDRLSRRRRTALPNALQLAADSKGRRVIVHVLPTVPAYCPRGSSERNLGWRALGPSPSEPGVSCGTQCQMDIFGRKTGGAWNFSPQGATCETQLASALDCWDR
jgi:hypothetical protein